MDVTVKCDSAHDVRRRADEVTASTQSSPPSLPELRQRHLPTEECRNIHEAFSIERRKIHATSAQQRNSLNTTSDLIKQNISQNCCFWTHHRWLDLEATEVWEGTHDWSWRGELGSHGLCCSIVRKLLPFFLTFRCWDGENFRAWMWRPWIVNHMNGFVDSGGYPPMDNVFDLGAEMAASG